MPSSSSERSSSKQADGFDGGLSYEDVEEFLHLRNRRRRSWLSCLMVIVGGAMLANGYFSEHFRNSSLALGICLTVVGCMDLNPQFRQAMNLLERYIAQDPQAKAKLETLDGTQFNKRLADGKYKPQQGRQAGN